MRIRTVKPAFMVHEGLQDLEVAHPGKYIMLTFQGLWMLSDCNGKFEYKPRQMRLTILPFIPYEQQDALDILENEGFFQTYIVNGKKYGRIPSFLDHQRINTKEKQEGSKYPDPEQVTQVGATGTQEGQPQPLTGTKEESQEEERSIGKDISNDACDLKFSKEILEDFGFNEITGFNKLSLINAFLNVQKAGGRLEYFTNQYLKYQEYKCISGEKRHNFTSFFGNQSNRFEDGKWDEANWEQRLKEYKKSDKKHIAQDSSIEMLK